MAGLWDGGRFHLKPFWAQKTTVVANQQNRLR
jgi:hypothetical protein